MGARREPRVGCRHISGEGICCLLGIFRCRCTALLSTCLRLEKHLNLLMSVDSFHCTEKDGQGVTMLVFVMLFFSSIYPLISNGTAQSWVTNHRMNSSFVYDQHVGVLNVGHSVLVALIRINYYCVGLVTQARPHLHIHRPPYSLL